MSVPAEQMPPQSASVPPSAPEQAPAPAPSPISAPDQSKGSQSVAAVNVQTAMLMLQHALPGFGLGSREGKSIMECLKRLAIDFGDVRPSRELVPAQIMQLNRSMQTANPVQTPTPPQ